MANAESTQDSGAPRLIRRISAFACLLAYVAIVTGSARAQVTLPALGNISTLAGSGTYGYGGDGGAATVAQLQYPNSVAVDASGNIYISDEQNYRIRKVAAATGIITTVAGNGTSGYSGDGGIATQAKLSEPHGIAIDGSGNLYIADTSSNCIRKVASSGIITTFAGICDGWGGGYSGDGGQATSALLFLPLSVAVDGSGNVYIADSANSLIRKVTTNGIISTIGGSCTGYSSYNFCTKPRGYGGDGGPATSATLNYPTGISVDGSGNVYFSDYKNYRVRKIAAGTSIITTVAGNGTSGYSGDGGAATAAEVSKPWGVAVDSSGNIYVADWMNQSVRKITSAGVINTIAGNGTAGYSGDGGAATSAAMEDPEGVAIDRSGNLYIADTDNNRIRVVGTSNQATPTFSPTPGTYTSAQTVAISDSTNGTTIYYTTDGTIPTASSTRYTGPITVNSTETIRAVAVTGSTISSVATAVYTINSPLTFVPAAGDYASALAVIISSSTSGATIYYTTDGTTPTTLSAQYTGPLTVNSSETIKAIAASGTTSSIVATAAYTINASSTPARKTATVTINGSELTGDAGVITLSFNGFTESAVYGPYSTPASVASTFGAKFSNDYLQAGLCAYASGATITFKLRGAASFGTLDVAGSTTSFQIAGSGFVTQATTTVDTGTVTLTVGGVVAAKTNYGEGATPSSIAEGLAAGVQSGSPVIVNAADSVLFLQSKQAGAGSNYSYSLQTTSWDSTDFPNPSFVSGGVSGNLSGGANAGSGSPQTIYSYSIPSYVSGSTPTGYDADGNIVGYTDSVMGTWSMASGYDTLNRLTSASATSGTYAGIQISWSYDAFGNRTSESFSGSSNVLLPTSSTTFYNANNQISSTTLGPVQYNPAGGGGVTLDNQNQYLYDGDGRICAVRNLMSGTLTGYVFDADGTRVSTGTITTWGSCDPSINGYQAVKDSILGPTGGQLTETGIDAYGKVVWAHTNVWAAGQLLATYDPNGVHFNITDWEGSRRVQTDYQGVVEQTCTNLPYGDGVSCGPTPSEELYAGLDRDSESGLDHAMYRQYSSTFGRWTTPDPYGGSYNFTNPQSLNRYAYVNGSPLGATDRSGLFPCPLCVFSYNGGSSTSFSFWGGGAGLSSSLLSSILGYAAPFVFGADIFELGKAAGFWGGGPQFHGNAPASQSGKNVPNAPKDGFADCGCIAGQGLFHSPQAQQTWVNANQGVETVTKYAAQAYLTAFTLGASSFGSSVGSLGLEATASTTPGFGTAAFGTAMHAQFGEVLLEQTGTAAEDWIFAAPNAPGVDATYLGSENLGFNAAELKPFGFDMNAVGNQIGSFANQPGATSVWWYNSNGIIGDTGVIFH